MVRVRVGVRIRDGDSDGVRARIGVEVVTVHCVSSIVRVIDSVSVPTAVVVRFHVHEYCKLELP